MAGLGSLVVRLSADIAQFQSDLGRAAHVADKFGGQIKKALGAIGVGVTFAGLTAFLKESVDAAARLDDLAEKTGASVENLSKLSQVARISGTDIGVVETFLIKLNKALHDTDDEAKGANRALEAIGLRAKDLRGLDPAEAMRKIAEQLNKFADGGGKTAAILALTGKSAAEALPFLKDLATEIGISSRVTAEQAAQAEELQKAMRRLSNASTEASQAMARELIPTLSNIVEQFAKGKEIAGGFFNAIMLFGTINPFKTSGENIKSLGVTLDELKAKRETLIGQGRSGWLPQIDAEIAKTQKQIEFSKLLQRQDALAINAGRGRLDAKDLGPGGGARLDFSAKDSKPNKELEKALELMKKQVGDFNKDYWDAIQERNEVEAQLVAAGQIKAAEEHAKGAALMQQQILDNIDAIQDREVEIGQAAGLAANKGKSAFQELEEQTKKNSEAARELGMTFTSAFEDAAIEGKKFSEVLKGLLQDVARLVLRRGVTEPLLAAAGEAFKGFNFANLFGLGGTGTGVGHLTRAGGGGFGAGDTMLVGERGPEVVRFNRGGDVIPNHALGGGEFNFNVTFGSGPPTDPQAVVSALLPIVQSIVDGRIGNQLRPGGVFNPT